MNLRCCRLLISSIGLIAVLTNSAVISAQETKPTSQPDSGRVFFEIRALGFFQNYEYFNPIKQGETLPGIWLQPTISYRPFDGFNFRAGIHILNYSGKSTLAKVQPLLSMETDLYQNLKLILGSFYMQDHHRLEIPLYRDDFYYKKPVENGVELRLNSKKVWINVWISWESFILPHDPFQERLFAGQSVQAKLFSSKNFQITLPFQQTFAHRGGQNIAIDTTIMTLYNVASGLTFNYKRIGLTAMYMGYKDLSPEKQQAYKQGSAVWVNFFYNSKILQLSGGYWNAHQFMSPKGEELLMSALTESNSMRYPNLEVCFGNVKISKELKNVGSLVFTAGLFQNLRLSKPDYFYGISIHVNQEFFLGKVKASQLVTK
jgi:hypothetical protein